MKFQIEYTGFAVQRVLQFIVEEFSFDMKPVVPSLNFDIVVNKINLTVVGQDNRIVQIWGYGGSDTKWIISDCNPPASRRGLVKVVGDFVYGAGAYGIQDADFSVYINHETGWICIGNPDRQGDSVEFINNCIIVLDDNSEFVSLWLKPQMIYATSD